VLPDAKCAACGQPVSKESGGYTQHANRDYVHYGECDGVYSAKRAEEARLAALEQVKAKMDASRLRVEAHEREMSRLAKQRQDPELLAGTAGMTRAEFERAKREALDREFK
jgi:hypothetical protein